MEELRFDGVFYVALVALSAPLITRLVPRLRLPAVAVEILLGVILGPSVLDLVHLDLPLQVFGAAGLAYLLFLGGLEIDLSALHGRVAQLLLAWGASCAIALGASLLIFQIDRVDKPIMIAIALASTSLGLVVPVLRDTGETRSPFGQTLLAASSVAEFGALLLVSIFFSTSGTDAGSNLFLLATFGLAIVVAGVTLARAGTRTNLFSALDMLADSASQTRVRGIMVVLFFFVALAGKLGFEAILGSFSAGVLLRFLDRDGRLEEEKLRYKIDAIGYGFLVPMFFVTSGLKINVKALFDSPRALLLIPVLVVAMLVVRGVPMLLFRASFDRRRLFAGGLLSGVNLSFMVIVSSIGQQEGIIDAPTGAGMVLAGVVTVVVFPPVAVAIFPRTEELDPDWDEIAAP